MTRLEPLDPDALTAEQRQLYDEIAATRDGNVGGPYLAWLRLPEVCTLKNQLGNALRVTGNLDPRVFELVVLVTTSFWSAQYAWSVHSRDASRVGVPDSVIEAIRLGRRPRFDREDQECVYDLAGELLERRSISDAVYDRALSVLGYEQVIEVVAVIGNYTMASLTLLAFEVEPRDGSRPLPALDPDGQVLG